MMNSGTVRDNVRNHLSVVEKATRTTQLRAVAAYLYGDAMLAQYDIACGCYGDDEGQNAAIALAEACVDVINAPILEVQDLFDRVEAFAQEFVDYLESVSS